MKGLVSVLHLTVLTLIIVVASFVQAVVRFFYHVFPFKALLDACYVRSHAIRRAFAFRLSSSDPTDALRAADTARHLIERAGFGCEEHVVTTEDGFVLGLQRIIVPPHPTCSSSHPRTRTRSLNGLEPTSFDSARSAPSRRPPVLIMHGLMQCSEAWLVGDRGASLPYILADAGFDVWLGNNRGNRYSSKHVQHSPGSEEYWNFCIDDLARHDFPSMVKYVLRTARADKVAYIGFSQGTAQAFASLCLTPDLNDALSVFIALSPALAVRPLAKSPLTALVQSNLGFIYALFGVRSMIPVALNMRAVLSNAAWVQIIDSSVLYLFRWHARLISPIRKHEAYRHIFSLCSVKTVVHWFQIIATQRFAMFSDLRAPSLFPFASTEEHAIAPLYDTRKISVPLAAFVGEADTLIDIGRLIALLPPASAPVPMPSRSQESSAELSALFQSVTYGGEADARGMPHRLVLPCSQQQDEFEAQLSQHLQIVSSPHGHNDMRRRRRASTMSDSGTQVPTNAGSAHMMSPPRRAGRLRLESVEDAGDAMVHQQPHARARSHGHPHPHREQFSVHRMVGVLNAAIDSLVGSGDYDAMYAKKSRRGHPLTAAAPAASSHAHTSTAPAYAGWRRRLESGSMIDLRALADAATLDAPRGQPSSAPHDTRALAADSEGDADPRASLASGVEDPAAPASRAPPSMEFSDGGTGSLVAQLGSGEVADVPMNHEPEHVHPVTAASSPAWRGGSVKSGAAASATSTRWSMQAQPLQVFVEPEYEHLDFKWADTCRTRTYPAIVCILRRYAHLQFAPPVLCSSCSGHVAETVRDTSAPIVRRRVPAVSSGDDAISAPARAHSRSRPASSSRTSSTRQRSRSARASPHTRTRDVRDTRVSEAAHVADGSTTASGTVAQASPPRAPAAASNLSVLHTMMMLGMLPPQSPTRLFGHGGVAGGAPRASAAGAAGGASPLQAGPS